MKILIAVFCVLAAVMILLLIPVILRFSYKNGGMRAYVRYLFIKIDFSPERLGKRAAKKAAREVKKEEKKQEDEEEESPKKANAAIDTAKTVWSLLKAAKWGLNLIRKHLLFSGVRLYIVVGGEDAHQTAVKYGKIGAAVYLGEDIFRQVFRLRQPDIRVAPDFLAEKTYVEAAFRVRLRPIIALIAASYAFTHFIRAQAHNKKKREYVKGVKKHEPASGK